MLAGSLLRLTMHRGSPEPLHSQTLQLTRLIYLATLCNCDKIAYFGTKNTLFYLVIMYVASYTPRPTNTVGFVVQRSINFSKRTKIYGKYNKNTKQWKSENSTTPARKCHRIHDNPPSRQGGSHVRISIMEG